MQKISPCLWFTDDASEAAKLYTSIFKNSKIHKTTYYSASSAKVSGMPEGSVLTVDFQIAGLQVQALRGGPYFKHTPATSLFVTCGSADELDSIYKKLSPGGETQMELGEYPFSKRYAFFSDKYGVHWQLFLEEGAAQKITPCIIFGGDKQGLGAKAVPFYCELFKESQVIVDKRYGKNEGGLEGSIMHARVSFFGSEMVIMDAGQNAPLPLTGAISFTVLCKNQDEVDYFWNTIAKSGKEIQCGWIEDQFGVSWQIVPEGTDELVFGPDKAAAERANEAMLKMKKLNINELRKAYENR